MHVEAPSCKLEAAPLRDARGWIDDDLAIDENGFADAAGNAAPNPMSADWPMEMLITTTLAEQDGKMVLTLVSQPINATEIECATFKAGHASINILRRSWRRAQHRSPPARE